MKRGEGEGNVKREKRKGRGEERGESGEYVGILLVGFVGGSSMALT